MLFTFSDRSRGNLNEIMNEVHELVEKVNNFEGEKNDKEYKQLDEWLTSSILTLDAIDSDGDEDIRGQRKEIIERINHSLDKLEAGTIDSSGNAPNQTTFRLEDKENQYPFSESPQAGTSNQKLPRKRKSKKGFQSLYYMNSPQESENEEQDMVSQDIR
jgi:hypothetical protein